MKKIYCLFVAVFTLTGIHAAEIKTLTLYDIEFNSETGLIYNDDNFDITATNCINEVMEGLVSLDCLFDNGSRENLKYIGLYNQTVINTIGEKAYIDIRYKGNKSVRNIEFFGFGDGSGSSSDAILYAGPNTIDNLPFYEGFDYGLEDGSTIEKSMAFYVSMDGYDGIEYTCLNQSTKYYVPDTINTIVFNPGLTPPIQITEYPDMRKTLKDFRLEWTSAQFASVTKIMGMKITYEDDDIIVGIDDNLNEEDDIFIKKQMNGCYELSTQCKVEIYNMQGSVINTQEKTQIIDLSPYPNGIYLLRLSDTDKQITRTIKLIHTF